MKHLYFCLMLFAMMSVAQEVTAGSDSAAYYEFSIESSQIAGLRAFESAPLVYLCNYGDGASMLKTRVEVVKCKYPASQISCRLKKDRLPVYSNIFVRLRGSPIPEVSMIGEIYRDDAPRIDRLVFESRGVSTMQGLADVSGIGSRKPTVKMTAQDSVSKSPKEHRVQVSKYSYDQLAGTGSQEFLIKKTLSGTNVPFSIKSGILEAKTFLTEKNVGGKSDGKIILEKSTGENFSFSVNSDWGSGFVANFAFKNTSATPLSGWSIEFDFPYQITQVWNADLVSSVSNHHVIKNLSWNASPALGETVSFGFVGNPGNVDKAPQNIKLNGGGNSSGELTAKDDLASTENTASVLIQVLSNDLIPDGVSAFVKEISAVSHGDAAISADGKSVAYTPYMGFVGQDNFRYTVLASDGRTSSALVTVSVLAPPSEIPPAPSISILKDWEKGGYTVQWTKWSGASATVWRILEDGIQIHEEPIVGASLQKGEFHLGSSKDYGVYGYQVELANSAGASRSEIKYYAVDNAGMISIGGLDNGRQALQVTMDFEEKSVFTLSNLVNPNAGFTVSTNNPTVISCSVDNGRLNLSALKSGRAGLKIVDTESGEARYLGVRVKDADGKLPGMPSHLAIGSVSEDTEADLGFWRSFGADLLNRRMDIRYIYINGGPKNQGVGWRTWTDRDGFRVTSYVRESLKLGMIPFLVYYNIPDGGESYYTNKEHIQNPDYMLGYFSDLKFALELAKKEAGDEIVGFLLEPDFIGYLAQNDGSPDRIPARTDAAYESGAIVRGEDPDFPDTVAGLVQAINYVISKHLPNAYFGWQFNLWASPAGGFTTQIPGKGIVHLTDNLGVQNGREAIRKEAAAITNYYVSAGVLSHGASFVSIDKYGLDAGAEGKNANPADSTWFWNAIHWTNYLEVVKSMHIGTGLPVILWQLPVGHINSSIAENPYASDGEFPELPNTPLHFEDSAPSYFFGDSFMAEGERLEYFAQGDGVHADGTQIKWDGHLKLAKDAGVIAALFGAGVGHSTDGVGAPPTDDFWWIVKSQEYFRSPVMLGATNIGENHSPIASDDTGKTYMDKAVALDVLWNDTDPDGDNLSIVKVSSPLNGMATIDLQKILYTPNIGFSGTDSFEYTVIDGRGGEALAKLTVYVEKVPAFDGTKVSFKVTGDWGSGFNGEIEIVYRGDVPIQGWTLEFDFPYQINSIWNAVIVSRDGLRYQIKNESWNGSLSTGSSVSFGFGGSPGNVSTNPYNILFNGNTLK